MRTLATFVIALICVGLVAHATGTGPARASRTPWADSVTSKTSLKPSPAPPCFDPEEFLKQYHSSEAMRQGIARWESRMRLAAEQGRNGGFARARSGAAPLAVELTSFSGTTKRVWVAAKDWWHGNQHGSRELVESAARRHLDLDGCMRGAIASVNAGLAWVCQEEMAARQRLLAEALRAAGVPQDRIVTVSQSIQALMVGDAYAALSGTSSALAASSAGSAAVAGVVGGLGTGMAIIALGGALGPETLGASVLAGTAIGAAVMWWEQGKSRATIERECQAAIGRIECELAARIDGQVQQVSVRVLEQMERVEERSIEALDGIPLLPHAVAAR